jgi:hypothetical protein
MTQYAPRSLHHEYELYVEREIEDYKDSISRTVLLSIGDEAIARMRDQEQTGFTELLLWQEVDRIIRERKRVPKFETWRRRRLRLLREFRRPEHWGWLPDAPVVRAIEPAANARVLVAGSNVEESTLYFAAHGCVVTAVEQEPDIVERVVAAAERVGLTARVQGRVGALDGWAPDGPLTAVVCSPTAFGGLSAEARARVIEVLQTATLDGGVHLVQTIAAGQNALTIDELRSKYRGWSVSVERDDAAGRTFLARKGAA